MNRRNFVNLVTGAALGSGISRVQAEDLQGRSVPLHFTNSRTGIGPFTSMGTGKAPHIFLITADMVSPDLYHPARPLSKHIHIPAIRSMMKDGVFFSNAFCTVPLCSPSRASYLTGRYSYIQGNGERAPEGLDTQLRPNDIIFPEYLRASGYITRQIGKAHVGTTKFLDAFGENDQPWDRWSPPVFDDDAYLSYQRRLGVKPQKYSREIVFKQQDRTSPGNSVGGWIEQEDGKPFPFEAQYSYFQSKLAMDILQDLVSTGVAEKHPVYLQLDIFDPHQPFSIPAGFEEREAELRRIMTLPESYDVVHRRDFSPNPDDPAILDIYCKYWGIYDPKMLLEYRIAYALQMELVDRVIARFLDGLKQLGLYENAMIAFISDHGEMNGRRALVDKGVYLYPDVLRVPFVLKPPAGADAAKGSTVQESVSLLDLSQTLLETARVRPEAKFDGRSLLPVLRAEKLTRENPLLFFGGWHVGVNFACGLEHQTSNGRHFLYAYNCSSPEDELYDIDSDDAVNLIHDPAYSSVRIEMIQRLGLALQQDPRWLGYWAEFRIARYASLPKTKGDMQLFTKPT